MAKERSVDIVHGSGDVFADLGVKYSDHELIKIAIATSISETIQDRELTQVRAAKLLGIDQPKISKIVRGDLAGFSVERLLDYLLLIGRDFQFHIPAGYSDEPGKVRATG